MKGKIPDKAEISCSMNPYFKCKRIKDSNI